MRIYAPKFKIFFGYACNSPLVNGVTADEQLNEWLEKNQDVDIVDWKFQQGDGWNHSICILYYEKQSSEISEDKGECKNDFCEF